MALCIKCFKHEKNISCTGEKQKHRHPKDTKFIVCSTCIQKRLNEKVFTHLWDIDSKKLKPLIQKIHNSLVLNGTFIGTLFISTKNQAPNKELLEKLGAHFYKNEYLVPALLEHSGFNIEECIPRFVKGSDSRCIQFIATKLSD